MGQSFLTHDEKSSGSPSPDLLQFNGVASRKFFGSLSSVKETSTSSSSRSPLLESADSEERNLNVSSSSTSSSRSPLSPPLTDASSDLYNTLVPTPILPGNVNRLREKFLGSGRPKTICLDSDQINYFKNENLQKQVYSDLDFRHFTRPATSSPSATARARSGAVESMRSRSSLSALSPASYRNMKSRARTLPLAASIYDEKLTVIRSDNDFSDSFRKLTLAETASNNYNMDNFTNENPLVRHHRPRTRPYVPPPRSVIIRAGFLPVLQTVNILPSQINRASVSFSDEVSPPTPAQRESLKKESSSECVTAPRPNISPRRIKKEDLQQTSSPPLEAERKAHSSTVTNREDHIEKKVLMKDAEVNTSAEVLVLPKGTKTSVLLKTGIIDELDGSPRNKRRRKRKPRGIRRVARVFGRIMIRIVELF